MGRFFILTGSLLDLVVVGLFISLATNFSQGSLIVTTMLEPLVCEGSETLWYRDDQRFICINDQYEERLVTDEAMPYVIVGGVGGLILGIMLVNIGSRSLAKEQRQSQQYDMSNMQSAFSEVYQDGAQVDVSQINLEDISARIPPEAQAILRHVVGQIGDVLDVGSLSERLQQLEDARQQGLISQAEYDRVRQAILDSMDD